MSWSGHKVSWDQKTDSAEQKHPFFVSLSFQMHGIFRSLSSLEEARGELQEVSRERNMGLDF